MQPAPALMSLVQKSGEYLTARGIANGRREAEWIFAETLKLSRLELYTKFDMPLGEAEVARLRELVQRRGKREPLAYVLGNQEFRGLRLAVGPGVLVPRPETEELVERVLAELPAGAARALDVGTGSGAIALAIRHARGDCAVEATDASDAALAFARANGAALGLDVAWRRADLATGCVGPYDAVVANLPYIAESERGECDPELAFEPAEALFAADDGLAAMARLIGDADRLLALLGILWLEHGWKQGAAVRALAERARLSVTTIVDGGGRDRIARLTRSAP